MRALSRIVLLALAGACSKGVAPGLDLLTCDGGPCADPGVIQGQVVFSGTARGDAVLLLFDTAALPPPDGNATSAVEVARVSRAQLFGAAAPSSVGPFAAPFTFTEVPSGHSYQIRAFLDVAGKFNPVFDFSQSPRAGDVAGGFGTVSANGVPQLGSIAVAPDQIVSGANVALLQTLPFDPPSFVIQGGSQTFDVNIDRPVALALSTTRLSAPDASFTKAHFAVELDRAPNGNARSSFADGILDVFPRIALRQLQDGSGNAVAAGRGALIPCRTLVTPVLPAVVQLPATATPLALDTVTALVEPFAVDANTQAPLPAIPAGVYQVVVIEKSGQVWTVPNALGTRSLGADFVATQGQTITFKQLSTPAQGSISGNVVFQGGAAVKSGNIIVQAFANDPQNPPPPVGAAQPVRVQVIPAAQVTPTAAGFTASYALKGLAPGSYFVLALDDVDGNFAPIDLLQTATKADLAGGIVNPTTLRPVPVTVGNGALTNQTVVLGAPIGLDPPVFTLDDSQGAARMSSTATAPVHFGLVAQPLSFPIGSAAQPVFTVAFVPDANGNPADADGDGLLDVWPRVFLERLDPADPTNLTTFRDPQTGAPRTELIPAAVDPTPFLSQLQGGTPVVLTTQVPVVARPALVDATNPDAKTVGPLVPGNYRIVVVNQTGQVWQIPNQSSVVLPSEVCAQGASSCAPGTVQTQSQGRAFVVTPPGG
ncbi:MAG TPA: hypothetical protein VGH20_13355 [Myxococcales bacterium]|jgi:hypothetical protein